MKGTTDLDYMAVADLGLGARAYNCLRRSQITSVAQLVRLTRTDLLAIRGLGDGSASEIEWALRSLGLSLGTELADVASDEPKGDELPEFLTIAEVAARLRCSTKTVRRSISSGSIPAYRIPGGHEIRVARADLESAIWASRVAVTP